MTTLLCIEDEPVMREAIAETLEDEGYDVLRACDGQEGLETLLDHKPDLVVCDITMPNKDGYQLLKEVRCMDQIIGETPFIFLTALADKQDVLDGLNQGADDYIAKPVDFDLLKAKIASRLRQIARFRQQRDSEQQTSWYLEPA